MVRIGGRDLDDLVRDGFASNDVGAFVALMAGQAAA
jgi:hypothetical protein